MIRMLNSFALTNQIGQLLLFTNGGILNQNTVEKNFNVKSKLTHYHFMTQRCPHNDTVYFFYRLTKKCDCFAKSAFSRP